MKRSTKSFACAALLALATFSGAQTAAPKPVAPAPAALSLENDRIAMAEFKKLYAKGGVVVVDVRSEGMYVAGHISGALSIPEHTINASLAEKLKKMGKPVATYCS